jgi:hypothetical protein
MVNALILVMAVVYVWMLYNVAALITRRIKRFSLFQLLIAMTVVSMIMGRAVMRWQSSFDFPPLPTNP